MTPHELRPPRVRLAVFVAAATLFCGCDAVPPRHEATPSATAKTAATNATATTAATNATATTATATNATATTATATNATATTATATNATATTAAKVTTRYPAPQRLVAIGDLHGDIGAARAALRLAGVLDDADAWSGGKTFVVQTGDVLDRGDDEQAILDLLDRLVGEAERAGGKLLLLNGNHELMNAAGDFRYVTPLGFRDFEDVADDGATSSTALKRLAPEARARARAFFPGGKYALQLAKNPVVAVVGETVFAHGGVAPKFARAIEAMNEEVAAWLAGGSPRGARVLGLDDGPVWSRTFAEDPGAGDPNGDMCARLDESLALVGAKRMVVGHTVQKTINSACDGKVWRIDVGMAKAYGGRPEVLAIEGASVRVLRSR
ncbi:MAG: calcineurin [Myxococcales bacterium]|nr:calcineurin [Myxococcales bacterium]